MGKGICGTLSVFVSAFIISANISNNCVTATGYKQNLSTIMKLSPFRTTTHPLTISGHSSGASFAHILHIAHSKLFSGVGIFAGLYYEYNGAPNTSKSWRTDPVGVRIDASIRALQKYQKEGLIDKLKNLAHQKVFIWAGTADPYHNITERFGMVNIYEPHIDSPLQMYTKVQFANHDYPLGRCDPATEIKGYRAQCYYDAKREMFRFLYGKKPRISENGPFNQLQEFDQSEFFKEIRGEIAMNDIGLLYIPKKCLLQECRIHFYFHGCAPKATVQDHKNDILGKNFLGIAEGTGIIFVFPLTLHSASTFGCWDYLGWTNPGYATKKGNQVRVLRRIIRRIVGK